MTNSSNLYVGMDVHKDSVDIALAEGDGRQEVRHYGSVGGDLTALDQAVRKLQATGRTLNELKGPGTNSFSAEERSHCNLK